MLNTGVNHLKVTKYCVILNQICICICNYNFYNTLKNSLSIGSKS